jgi:putative Mg2+ transporter-C (MgtC) family protein
MTMPIEQAAINLAAALGLSAVIGFERQWRNRLAGLRTNTLVSLGAATFVIFAALVPGEASPTRVAAQVVSGIGFLGAGLIFREGLSVRGLNTAATLWCSAAIGVLAGAGYLLLATVATAFVVFVNLLLRPIVNFIIREPLTSTELEIGYVLGLLIGDGALNYREEKILETFYSYNVNKWATATLDYQFIADPAYNADRWPVSLFAARLHAEF